MILILLIAALLLTGCNVKPDCNQYGDIGLCIATQEAINEKAFPNAGELSQSVEDLGIGGLYDDFTRTVWTRRDLDFNTDLGKRVLIHELVHYIQYKMDLDKLAENKLDLEPLAYEIESQFIAMLRTRRKKKEF